MSMTTLYFITMLDNFKDLFFIVAGISIITLVIFIVNYFSEEGDDNKLKKISLKIVKIFIPIFLFSIIVLTFVPTTKQAVFIYMAEGITNNEDAKQIPKNTIKFLNLKLKEYIQDQEIKMDKTK